MAEIESVPSRGGERIHPSPKILFFVLVATAISPILARSFAILQQSICVVSPNKIEVIL